MRFLVADDDPPMREMLAEVLGVAGHDVELFEDGAAAWEAWQTNPSAMVVLDLEMPRMTGLEVCRKIRSHPAGLDTYLLVITVRSTATDLQSVLDAGADDYLPKPVTASDVLARVRIAEKRIEAASARRHAEAELHRARYLAGIGEVSLALQHEINNPLAALLTTSALITGGMMRPDEIPESLKTIDTQAQRIADVLKRLREVHQAPRTVEYISGQRMVDLGPDDRDPQKG